jgi:hypothetical protein
VSTKQTACKNPIDLRNSAHDKRGLSSKVYVLVSSGSSYRRPVRYATRLRRRLLRQDNRAAGKYVEQGHAGWYPFELPCSSRKAVGGHKLVARNDDIVQGKVDC